MPGKTAVSLPLIGRRIKTVQELRSGTPIQRGGVGRRLKWRKLQGMFSGCGEV